jgi:hypothetical protein
MLMLVALIAATSTRPYTAVSVVQLLWAAVESVRSIQARSADRAPTRNIASSVVGLVPVCALAVMVLLPYAFYGMAKNLLDCTVGANTAIVAADCNS